MGAMKNCESIEEQQAYWDKQKTASDSNSNLIDGLCCPCCGNKTEKIMNGGHWQYICNVRNGGCGTSSGLYEDEEEAAEYWGKRAI